MSYLCHKRTTRTQVKIAVTPANIRQGKKVLGINDRSRTLLGSINDEGKSFIELELDA